MNVIIVAFGLWPAELEANTVQLYSVDGLNPPCMWLPALVYVSMIGATPLTLGLQAKV